MKLLTYHGTLVQHPSSRTHLSHAPLAGSEPDGHDAEFGVGEGPRSVSVLAGGPIDVVPAGRPGTLSLMQSGMYFCAEPHERVLKADRTAISIWETFLPLEDSEVACLRQLLKQGWRPQGDADSAPALPVLVPGFGFRIGSVTVDLSAEPPIIESITAAIAMQRSAPVVDGPSAGLAAGELDLAPAPETIRTLPLVDRAAFLAGTNLAVKVPAAADGFRLPVTVCRADTQFVLYKYWNSLKPQLGLREPTSEARRARRKFVLLQKGVAGIMFDEHGTYSNAGYLHTLNDCPPGLRREGPTIKLDPTLLQRARRVPGVSVVMFNPHMRNYYHWLIECVLSLDILMPYLPPGARIILPPEVAEYRRTQATGFDHWRILDVLGFGSVPVLELDGEVCELDEVVWLDI